MDWLINLISLDESCLNTYKQLFHSLCLIPISHYVLAFTLIFAVFLYNFLEIHFFHDLFSGFRGDPVSLTFHPSSHIYHGVVSSCRILHGRQVHFSFFYFHFILFFSSNLSPVSLIYCTLVNYNCRYLATPWLSSPHFQTSFLNFFGNPPVFSYSRSEHFNSVFFIESYNYYFSQYNSNFISFFFLFFSFMFIFSLFI